ncbi:hypothetical protein Goarm_020940, partial [Gossypium armourianum]|nr:hypothetical protein [Gossypium armourianum]
DRDYQDVITITLKGLVLEFGENPHCLQSSPPMTFHATNDFEGPIPQVIGKFKEFCGPNAFTRSIPSFIGNLQQLESLDLSSNNLRSEIPLQLANLNFLSFLNISNNKLVGPIPTSTQLQSFPEASFENNTGLCGPPLKIMCRLPLAKKDSPSYYEIGSIMH